MNPIKPLDALQIRWVNAAVAIFERMNIADKDEIRILQFVPMFIESIGKDPRLGEALFQQLSERKMFSVMTFLLSVMAPSIVAQCVMGIPGEELAKACFPLSQPYRDAALSDCPRPLVQEVKHYCEGWQRRNCTDNILSQISQLPPRLRVFALDELSVVQRNSVLYDMGDEVTRAYFKQRGRSIGCS